jgi:uncharacterized LabA/DUF88 family protein
MFKAKNAGIDALAKKFPDRIAFLETVLTERTIVYMDYANVRNWSRRMQWQLDLQKLKDLLDSFSVLEVRFYFGTYQGDTKSQGFMTFVHRAGYKIRTKSVKIMKLSIDATSISPTSPDILASFITPTLLKQLRVEAIEYLNKELRALNKAGKTYLEHPKCNFDVEIGSDMRLDHLLKKADIFCLWSGDSDFADPVREILDAHKKVCVFGTAKGIAAELNELKSRGLEIFDIKKLREFIEK